MNNSGYYLYLTLGEECLIEQPWINISLYQLRKKIKNINITTTDGLILQEYLRTIDHFNKHLSNFLVQHQKYQNVFMDVTLTKEQKVEKSKLYTDSQLFIMNSNAELLFQKALLYRLASAIKEETKNEVYVGDTRGCAYLFIQMKLSDQFNQNDYELVLQIQGQTIKFMMQNQQRLKIQKMKEIFTTLKYEFKWRRLHEQKCRSSIAISKLLLKRIEELSFNDLQRLYLAEVRLGQQMAKRLSELLKEIDDETFSLV